MSLILTAFFLQAISTAAQPNPPQPPIQSLPATNDVGISRVVLENVKVKGHPTDPYTHFTLKTYPLNSRSLGWQLWHTTVTDPSGQKFRGKTPTRIPGVLSTNGPWHIHLQGKEYVGSDIDYLPRSGEARNCGIRPRAQDYGVQHLFLMGKGSYRFRGRNIEEANPDPHENELSLEEDQGLIVVNTVKPAVLLLFEPGKTRIPLSARLRERPWRDHGVPFEPRTFLKLKYFSDGLELEAQLLSFEKGLRSPLTTNKIEVEIVANLPAINFHLDPKDLDK